MQYQKEEVRRAILKAAKEEFMEKSYQQASVRQIAQKADVLPSNIYNYFGSKDEIFKEILKPILKKIKRGKEFVKKHEFDRNPQEHGGLEEHIDIVLVATDFIENNRELLKLLVFKAHGSSLENYGEKLVDWYTDNWYSVIEKNNQDSIDKFIMRNIMGVFYTLIKEALLQDLRGEELKKAAVEMMIFIYKGRSGLADWKEE